MTVVVPRGATREAGANPYAEKLPISPNIINIMPSLRFQKISIGFDYQFDGISRVAFVPKTIPLYSFVLNGRGSN